MGRGDDEPQEKAPVVEGEQAPKAVPLEVARRLRQQ